VSGRDEDRERWEERLDARLRELGTNSPYCCFEECDETFPLALTGVHPEIYCYEHDALRRSRPWREDHHPAGRRSDPETVTVPGNDHRILSGLQYGWPRETLRNPDGSPLLRAAASIRGWLDVLWLIMVRTVGWVPEFLERLDAWLRERLGPRWWDDFDGSDSCE
jgi:hypothetical protein